MDVEQILIFMGILRGGCLGGPYEDKLIDDIFKGRRYNRFSRPVALETDAVEVVFGISLQQIVDVDERNEMLNTNLWLNYHWKDYKLSWNETEYGGLDSIRLPAKLIWTPDILLYNSADEDIDSKYPTNIVVYSDGTCSWIPLGLYISSCAIDIRWFPFDDQFCKLKFGSWSYSGASINLTARSDTVDLTTYQQNGEWDLLEAPAVRSFVKYDCCDEPYIDITFTLHIRRRTLHYGFNLIIPCAFISLLALVTFLQPPEAGEKIGLGITILLSLSVFQLIVADLVPATSLAVPLVGVYFSLVMIMCTVSVMMTVVALNFHHRKPDMYEMPRWVRVVVCDWLSWLLRMSRPGPQHSGRRCLPRRSRLRRLASRAPASLSLISNIQDFNSIEHSISTGTAQLFHGSTTLVGELERELSAILVELRCITQKIRREVERVEETSDWRYAAMVVDRFCLCVCFFYFLIATLAVFMSVPNMKLHW